MSLNLSLTEHATLNQSMLQTNISALEEGEALLALLTAEQYVQGYKPAFHSTIGAHFRHVLEHYRCFIKQFSSAEICYDKRARDQDLECDIKYAKSTIKELIGEFQNLMNTDLNKACLVHDQLAQKAVSSTLHRELLFLQSHTMHHYAIIGAMTRSFGAQPDADFGVAIATRVHQECTDSSVNESTKNLQGER